MNKMRTMIAALMVLPLFSIGAQCNFPNDPTANDKAFRAAKKDTDFANSKPRTFTIKDKNFTTKREVAYYFPSQYDGKNRLPMVFLLHGSGLNPLDIFKRSDFASHAEKDGIVVAAIQGQIHKGRTYWNTPHDDKLPDDMAFMRQVKDWSAKNLCVDNRRIYATGFSGGARTISRAACEIEGFAAIAPIGGIRHQKSCPATGTSVPILTVHGTGDKVNKYNGYGPTGNGRWNDSVETAVEKWRKSNGCDDSVAADKKLKVEQRVWRQGCSDNAEVVFYRVLDAPHQWDILSDTSKVVMDFLNRHVLSK